jgi:hypothetical protein
MTWFLAIELMVGCQKRVKNTERNEIKKVLTSQIAIIVARFVERVTLKNLERKAC